MNIYIFENVSELTRYYHNSGGLVVIAPSKERVEELVEAHDEPINISDEEWDEVLEYPTVDIAKERVFVFPDAGCC